MNQPNGIPSNFPLKSQLECIVNRISFDSVQARDVTTIQFPHLSHLKPMRGYCLLSRSCGASGKRRPQDHIQCTHNPGAYLVTLVCFFIRSQGHVHRANEWCDTSPSIDPPAPHPNCATYIDDQTTATLHVHVWAS
ncbi:hypothetical protein D915_005053 [Fasciola hepatica]|uniref:Uncharacterized protein n=1 Tax=Fasciola hepatica TaxID=6192 RepID=A0A4E0RSZ3_FASHE|nr:hypothetical protein D915_005053 [Fasciola hepatica]